MVRVMKLAAPNSRDHAPASTPAIRGLENMSIDEKQCRACGEWKPLSEFHNDKAKPDGLTVKCKDCNNAASKAARDKDPKAYDRRNWELIQAKPEARRERKRKNSKTDTAQNNRLLHFFNKTLDWYRETLIEQGGGCAVCKIMNPSGRSEDFFHVDHDRSHCPERSCGDCVRGILCGRCNSYIMAVWDGSRNGTIDPELLPAVEAYVDAYLIRRMLLDELSEGVE